MSWDTTLPILVRSAIGDIASPPKYTDDNLAPVILTAAFSLFASVASITTPYVVDMENLEITPDPADPSSPDNSFVYLITLKTATMLLKSEVRVYGQQAIAIRDGTSAIDLKRDLKALDSLADSYSKELESAILQSLRSMTGVSGRMVVSPYRGLINGLDRYFYSYPYDHRSCRY